MCQLIKNKDNLAEIEIVLSWGSKMFPKVVVPNLVKLNNQ